MNIGAGGFMFQKAFTVNPSLTEYAAAQEGTSLSFHLDIGGKSAESRLPLNGLVLEFHDSAPGYIHPKLPGANGPHPHMSCGPKVLEVKEEGSVINMEGLQKVSMKNGCWEMVWRDNAPAGSIVCALDIPETVRRNEASLKSGRMYMSFPVWTVEGLIEKQKYKQLMEEKAVNFLEEKENELLKMKTTSNPILKALHYRNAAESVEKYYCLGMNRVAEIPSDNDVVPIQGNLMLCRKGTIWTKDDKALFGEHVLLGVASISASQLLP
eukprot:CAMPEP_0195517362 /NCGR_PEP_ID=MMETSP0794_2-20130614/10555_1 /TAXON_ID=515487 /ORGANISM="Stephanopyxis turris, Strain CCMP 815" /LENGTH=266 /DNA_ID=CAMNT_0040646153 /DNA_START=91 /DNA_END=891 /DNA_ORIENTATION=+